MAVTVIAAVLLLAGYGLYMEVMRENAYLSCTVEVQEGQKVIDTGLYGIVRSYVLCNGYNVSGDTAGS